MKRLQSGRLALILLLLLATVALAADGVIAKAKTALAEGRVDDVLFLLDGKAFAPEQRGEVARLLATAARRRLEEKDALYALQLAQTALRHAPNAPLALEVAARACLLEQQFTPAERYADRWMKVSPRAAPPRLLRAQIAVEEGEWSRALDVTAPLQGRRLAAPDRALLAELSNRARSELDDRSHGLTVVRSMDARFADALAQAAELERHHALAPVVRRSGVVVYGTSWCGFCKKARAYLTAHHVDFEDKDVERDHGAAEELAEKAAAQHLRPRGVPVIDVNGELVVGFNQPKIAALLHLTD